MGGIGDGVDWMGGGDWIGWEGVIGLDDWDGGVIGLDGGG